MSLVKFHEGNNRSLMPQGFNDIFESFFNDSFFSDRMMSRIPAVNVCETDSEYQIEMAAPGLNKEDFKLSLDRNILHISVEKKDEHEENGKQYNKREYNYSSFVRSFALPDSIDDAHIDAGYNDGVLKIHVAKKEEAKLSSRQIEIK